VKQRGASDIDGILPDPKEPHFKTGRRGEYKGSAPILWRRLLNALQGQSCDDIPPYMMSVAVNGGCTDFTVHPIKFVR